MEEKPCAAARLCAGQPSDHCGGGRVYRRERIAGDGTLPLPKEIGIFGLGKMGANVARQLREKGWRVVVANRSPDPIKRLAAEGFETAAMPEALLTKLSAIRAAAADAPPSGPRSSSTPRVLWLMITAGKGVDEFLFGSRGGSHGHRGVPRAKGITASLKRGDIVIDAGNSFFEDSVRRAKFLAKHGIRFVDVGFSGGPRGARHGGSLMIGGDAKKFRKSGAAFCGPVRAGRLCAFRQSRRGPFREDGAQRH